MAFAVTMTDSQQVRVTVSGAVDKKGNPAPLDGPPAFSSDQPSIVTFDTDPADASGMTGIAKAVGPISDGVNITISADAKIGPDVETITEVGLVQITAGQAVSFATTVGTPEEQP